VTAWIRDLETIATDYRYGLEDLQSPNDPDATVEIWEQVEGYTSNSMAHTSGALARLPYVDRGEDPMVCTT
jgi:hypothetical protein